MEKYYSIIEREEARSVLIKTLKPGTTIYTVLKHAPQSNSYCAINLYIIKKKCLVSITNEVTVFMGVSQHKKGGMIVKIKKEDAGTYVASKLAKY